MKKTSCLWFTVFIIASGCSRPGVQGNGVIKTESRAVAAFSKIVIAGGFEVQWSSGSPSLSLTTDENLLPLIETVVNGDTLQIQPTNSISTRQGIKVVLSSAALAGITLNGAITFKAAGLAGDDLKIDSNGASEISLAGAVTHLDVNMNGAGSFHGKSLATANTTLILNGAGSAEVNATEKLKVSIQGAGSVVYSGNPKTLDKNVAGIGSIRSAP